MAERTLSRATFTAADLAMLKAVFPLGRRQKGPTADVFLVSFEHAGLPWLIVSRQSDGCYVSIDPVTGVRIARPALSDLLLTGGAEWRPKHGLEFPRERELSCRPSPN